MTPKPLLILAAAAAFALPACSKRQAPTAAQPPAPQEATVEDAQASPSPETIIKPLEPLPPPPQFVTARADNYLHQNVVGEVDSFLSSQLRSFVEKQGRFPESFAEFATTRLDSVPRPPQGKKWVIDVASLQVKAVPVK